MLNRFRNAISRFLYGRYGADNLYNALFVLELILLFAATVLNIFGTVKPVLAWISIGFYVLAIGLIAWSIFRFFSRNIQKRRRENEAWLRFKGKFRKKPKTRLPADTADHIFRACPHCKSTLRLPRQTGRHEAKCPRCGKTFRVKVK